MTPAIAVPKGRLSEKYDLDWGPQWSPGEMARFFFGRDDRWVRHHHERDHFVLDGEALEVRRTPGGHRYFYLGDVERLAEALHKHDQKLITDQEYALAREAIWLQARIWGLDRPRQNGTRT